eukprot:6280630-Amphidinium_carterae.1
MAPSCHAGQHVLQTMPAIVLSGKGAEMQPKTLLLHPASSTWKLRGCGAPIKRTNIEDLRKEGNIEDNEMGQHRA